MVVAYVMVKANTGEADRLKSAIVEIDGVSRVNIVAGDVDFIVRVDVSDPPAVKNIASSIQAISGVEDTQTYIAMG